MKTVCVIGTGPAGLAAVKELKQVGLDVTAFDRSSSVGGRWTLDDQVPLGVWKELCMNINRRLLAFSDFPWQPNHYEGHERAFGGFFAHCSETKLYLEDYARQFDLFSSIQLETNVKSVEQTPHGGWKVTTEPVKEEGKPTTREFDALVVCSGIQAKPYNPLAPTFQSFTGQTLHSQYFRSLHDYAGQRVLVIGSGITGSEIASGLAVDGDCALVVNSMRRMSYHVQLVSKKAAAVDDTIFTRFPAWLGRFLPDSITSKGAKASLLGDFPNQCTKEIAGMEPDEDFRKNVVCPSRYSYPDNVKEGRIHVKPGVHSVEGKKVTFQDGSTQEFDVVIFATGFDLDFSFLPEKVKEKVLFTNPCTGKVEVAAHKLTLVPGMDNLAFCGVLYNFGPHFAMAEMQARYIAATFSGKMPRPSEAQLEAGVEQLKRWRASGDHHKNVFYSDFCEDLGDILGVTPSYWEGLWDSKKLLFGPLYPCQYRTNPNVDGKETAEKFQRLFDDYADKPQVSKRAFRASFCKGY